ncbi:hypothetical protein Cgig2_014115 [Carnegiea gigantea]|uniref:Uncharacterized protein n=1 Tax=Carnegiea gigantea TaxID=171969 RepID=A0A9Q1KXG8_9CARY|nr:hypothetical protein Cgig2_014115 [Carnegiea gigantea]
MHYYDESAETFLPTNTPFKKERVMTVEINWGGLLVQLYIEQEGKDSKSCCPPGASCEVPANSKAFCTCGPEWTCVIRKIDDPKESKPFYNCSAEGCVCITDEKQKGEASGEKQVEKTEGAYCECGEGYACTITKTEGPGAGKVFVECENGCKCEIPGCDGVAVMKD